MGAGLKNCDLREQIATVYRGRICQNVELEPLIEHYPCELAYALALIDTTDHRSITPGMGTAQLSERGIHHQEAAVHPLSSRLYLLQLPARRPP